MKKVLNFILAPFNLPALFVLICLFVYMTIIRSDVSETFSNVSFLCLIFIMTCLLMIAMSYTVQQRKDKVYKILSCRTAWQFLKKVAIYLASYLPAGYLYGKIGEFSQNLEATAKDGDATLLVVPLLSFLLLIIGFYFLGAFMRFLICQDALSIWHIKQTWFFIRDCFWRILGVLIILAVCRHYLKQALATAIATYPTQIAHFFGAINPYVFIFVVFYLIYLWAVFLAHVTCWIGSSYLKDTESN